MTAVETPVNWAIDSSFPKKKYAGTLTSHIQQKIKGHKRALLFPEDHLCSDLDVSSLYIDAQKPQPPHRSRI